MKDLSLNDFVYIKENELDKDFCQHIIDKFEKDDRKSQGIVGGGLRPDIKKSTDLSMTHYSGWEEEDKIFYKSLNKNIINYEKTRGAMYRKFILEESATTHVEDSGYQIQRTKPKEYYVWHHDQASFRSRRLTYIWYLNDVKDGGYTQFNTGLKIHPEAGKMMIFPALWPWMHRGYPPKTETKYIVTGWLKC